MSAHVRPVAIGRDGAYADSRLAGIADRADDDLIVVYDTGEPNLGGVPLPLLIELRDGPLPAARLHELSGVPKRTIRHLFTHPGNDHQAQVLLDAVVAHCRDALGVDAAALDPVVLLATYLTAMEKTKPACVIRGCDARADWGHAACPKHKRALTKRRYRRRRKEAETKNRITSDRLRRKR
jgi:hypothetical protein